MGAASETPYRTDRDALEERLATLKRELDAAREDVATLDGARARKAKLEREIVDVAARLAKGERRSPLDSIRIAAPCNADWEAMTGDARKRFCGSCQKHVYDISSMTRADAEALLATDASPCVRLYRRHDGTVITSDCPVGVRRRRLKRIVATTVGGGMLAGMMVLRWRQATVSPSVDAGSAAGQVEGPGGIKGPAADPMLRMMIVDPQPVATMGEPAPPTTAPSAQVREQPIHMGRAAVHRTPLTK